MLTWFKFVEKYAEEHNILYDIALESPECIRAYKEQQEEYRKKHQERVAAMTSIVQKNRNEIRKEIHRVRTLAMKEKLDQLSQEPLLSEIRDQEIQIEISEPIIVKNTKSPIKNFQISQPQLVHRKRVSMFFTPYG